VGRTRHAARARARPDDNQREFLTALGAEVQKARLRWAHAGDADPDGESSGHGTGKSAMGGWITDWILSTRPDSIGTVTAGTETQLRERTWSAIQSWTQLCLTAHWFNIQSFGIYSKVRPKTWKLVRQSCRKENAQSFAGQHSKPAAPPGTCSMKPPKSPI
jgi:hypothetical protein